VVPTTGDRRVTPNRGGILLDRLVILLVILAAAAAAMEVSSKIVAPFTVS